MPPQTISRKDVPKGAVLCEFCTAKCCRYFALQIDTPTSWSDFDHIRWYMLHGRISVFVEDDVWYLMVHADCKALQDDNRCGIYETRPGICRKYSTDNCEFDDDTTYEKFFETPEQMWDYAQVVCGPRKKPRRFSPQPPPASEVNLPVLGSVV